MLVRVVFRYRKGHIKLRIIIKWPAISLLYSILPTVGPNVRKHTQADTAQQKAVSQAFADGFADDLLVICGIGLGNGGHEQYGNRVGQCAREK